MPKQELSARKQKAVLWEAESTDEFGQSIVSDSPIEIDVRLVYNTRDGVNPQGQKISINATAIVDRDIAIGSIMWEGTLAGWAAVEMNVQNTLLQVVSLDKASDIKNRVIRRSVSLMFYRGTLPTTG